MFIAGLFTGIAITLTIMIVGIIAVTKDEGDDE